MSANNWIQFVKEWSKKNNKSYKDSITDMDCRCEYREKLKNKKNTKDMEGGLINPIKTLQKVFNVSKAVIYGRSDYTHKVREILKKYGDMKIKKMNVCRAPLSIFTTTTINVISLGEFQKRFNSLPYDKLFHLDIRLELEDSTIILLEKIETINAKKNPETRKDAECKNIYFNIELDLTPNKLLDGAKNIQKNKFFKYSAYNNNCQDFIMALLKGSNIGSQDDFDFIKQDTKSLFEDLPITRKIVNTVTDTVDRFKIITEGVGIHKSENYYIQSVVFDKSKFTPEQAKAWIKKNNYVYKKPDITDTQIRIRQVNPKYIEKKGFKEFRTKKIGRKSGISLIIAYKSKDNI